MQRATGPLKHDYLIKDLGRPRGWFKAHRYRYTCLRCGWAFVVENWSGKVRALGDAGQLLSDCETIARVSTFSDGPCQPDSARAPRRHQQPAIQPLAARSRKAIRRADGIIQIMTARQGA